MRKCDHVDDLFAINQIDLAIGSEEAAPAAGECYCLRMIDFKPRPALQNYGKRHERFSMKKRAQQGFEFLWLHVHILLRTS